MSHFGWCLSAYLLFQSQSGSFISPHGTVKDLELPGMGASSVKVT
uniref:Uncharacterized protein n=1 Tax=Utricularia reniformis TaxID=192314 RepID=A0A1Y0B0Q1_9LAMI|nr:hypothetical protein AEK19_MT0711 [Utricularia reniformis]ART30957.1 hypothetical protein AEK19_MT0711 [Utricularia reniformis]